MNNIVILIGPMRVGKSTIGNELASSFKLPQYTLDKFRDNCYKEIGFSNEQVNKIQKNEGYYGVYKYWKPYDFYTVKRVLANITGGIVDFGAGQSVYEDSRLLELMKTLLEPYKNVVLLLPSENKEESIRILEERLYSKEEQVLNRHFIEHISNYELAKIIVYTKGKNKIEICNEIINAIKC